MACSGGLFRHGLSSAGESPRHCPSGWSRPRCQAELLIAAVPQPPRPSALTWLPAVARAPEQYSAPRRETGSFHACLCLLPTRPGPQGACTPAKEPPASWGRGCWRVELTAFGPSGWVRPPLWTGVHGRDDATSRTLFYRPRHCLCQLESYFLLQKAPQKGWEMESCLQAVYFVVLPLRGFFYHLNKLI